MPRIVQVDGLGAVEFPDGFTDEQVESVFDGTYTPPDQRPDRGVVGELGARAVRGASSFFTGLAKTGEAAQRFYGPLAALSPLMMDHGRSARAIEEVTPGAGRRDGIVYDVAEGLGQIVPMVGTGLVGGSARLGGSALAGMAAAGSAGFGMEFSDAYDRERERQKSAGIDSENLAFAKAALYGAVSSVIESKFGAGRLAKRLGDAISGDVVARAAYAGIGPAMIRGAAASAAREGLVGFGQEALQRVAQDLIVNGDIDPSSAAYEGLIGGIVQGIVGAPIGAIETRSGANRAQLAEAMGSGRETAAADRLRSQTNALIADSAFEDERRAAEIGDLEDLGAGVFAERRARADAWRAANPEPNIPERRQSAGEIPIIGRPRVAVIDPTEAPQPIRNLRSRRVFVDTPPPPPSEWAEVTPEQRRVRDMLSAQDEARAREIEALEDQRQTDQLSQSIREESERQLSEVPGARPIRKSQRQLAQERGAVQGGQAQGGNVLEQPTPKESQPVAQGEAQAAQQAGVATKGRRLKGGVANEIQRQGQAQGMQVAPEGAMSFAEAARRLVGLGYTEQEIGAMRPEIAFEMARSGVALQRRPAAAQPQAGVSMPQAGRVVSAAAGRLRSMMEARGRMFGGGQRRVGGVPPLRPEIAERLRGIRRQEDDLADTARRSELAAQSRPPEQAPERRVPVGPKKSTTVGVGDEVSIGQSVKGYGTIKVYGRVQGFTPTGDVRVLWTKADYPKRVRKPEWVGTEQSVSPNLLYATGAKIDPIVGKRKFTPLTEEQRAKIEIPTGDLTRAETARAIALGYDYDDIFAANDSGGVDLRRKIQLNLRKSAIEPFQTKPPKAAAREADVQDELARLNREKTWIRVVKPGEEVRGPSSSLTQSWAAEDRGREQTGVRQDQGEIIQTKPKLEAYTDAEETSFGAPKPATASPARTSRIEIDPSAANTLRALVVTISEDSTIDRPALAIVSNDGSVRIVLNPDQMGSLSEDAVSDVMVEEGAHAATVRVIYREWVAAGSRGSFIEYLNGRLAEIWESLPAQERDAVVAEYGEGTPSQLGSEAIRRIVQLARTGRLTEQSLGRAAPQVRSLFARILDFLKRLFSGSKYGTLADEMVASVQKVLDSLPEIPSTATTEQTAGSGQTAEFGAPKLPKSRSDLVEGARRGSRGSVAQVTEAAARLQAGMFPSRVAEEILTRYDSATTPARDRIPGTSPRVESIVAASLRQVVNWLRIVENPQAQLPQSPESEQIGRHWVIETNANIQQRLRQAERKLEAARDEAEAHRDFPELASAAKLEARILGAESNSLVSRYATYIADRARLAPAGSNIRARLNSLEQRIRTNAANNPEIPAREVGAFSPGSVVNLVRWMSQQPGITTTSQSTPEQIVEQARATTGLMANSPSEAEDFDILLNGTRNPDGSIAVPPALYGMDSLPDVINALRALGDERQSVEQRVKDFQALAGDPDKSVSPREFARRYAALRERYKESNAIARAYSKQWRKIQDKIAAYGEVVGILETLITDPQYSNAVESAAMELGQSAVIVANPVRADGTLDIIDPFTGKAVKIGGTFTDEAFRDYIDRIKTLLENIRGYTEWYKALRSGADVERDAYSGIHGEDPFVYASYQQQIPFIEAALADASFAPEHNIRSPGPVGTLVRWFLGKTNMLSKRFLAERVGSWAGRRLITAMTSLNTLQGKLLNIREDPNHGIAVAQLRYIDALKSHKLDTSNEDVSWYIQNIANPLIASRQWFEQEPYVAGERLPTGEIVTPEDIAAIEVEGKQKSEVRKVSESGSLETKTGSRISEELGSTRRIRGRVVETPMRTTRRSIATGPMTVPKRTDVRRLKDSLEAFLAANDSERLKLLNPETHPDNYRDFVLGHLFDNDPTRNRNSKYEQELRALVSDHRNPDSDIKVSTWEGIADYLGEPVEDVQSQLISEIAAWAGQYASREANVRSLDGMEGLGRDLNQPIRVSIMDLGLDGSFLNPREHNNAPWTFYRYADVTANSMAEFFAIPVNIARASVIDALGIAASQVSNLIPETADVKALKRKMDDERRAGKGQFTLRQASELKDNLNNAIINYRRWAESHAEPFDKGVKQAIRLLNSNLGVTLLQSLTATANNTTSGLFGGAIMQEASLGGPMSVFGSLVAPPRAVATAALGRLIQAGKRNPEFASWLNSNRGWVSNALNVITEEWAKQSEINARLRKFGINTDLNWTERRALRKALPVGLAGLEESGVGRQSDWLLRAGRMVFESWAPAMAARFLPRQVDRGINAVVAHNWMRGIQAVMGYGLQAVENRVNADLGGDTSKLDPTNRSLVFRPDDFRMTPAQLNQLRDIFHPAGGLERTMFDYYKRHSAAPKEQRANVPLMSDEALTNVLWSALERSNVIRESNQLDWFKASGTTGAIFGLFMHWPMNFITRMTEIGESSPLGKGSPPWIAAVVAMLIVATLSKELTTPLIELVTGKTSGKLRLGNVVNDPSVGEAARYLATTSSMMIPYVGSFIDSALGGAYSRNPWDLTQSVPMAGFLVDVFDAAKNTLSSSDGRVMLDFVNRWMPLYAMAVNRAPGVQEDLAARNAVRAVRAAVPYGMEVRSVGQRGGGVTRMTPYTRYLRSAESAAYAGDEGALRENIAKAEEYQLSQGQDEESARRGVVSYLRSRMPFGRVFGRRVTPSEYERVTRRMVDSQRAAFEPSQMAYELVSQVTGKDFDPVREERQKRPAWATKRRRLRSARTRRTTTQYGQQKRRRLRSQPFQMLPA